VSARDIDSEKKLIKRKSRRRNQSRSCSNRLLYLTLQSEQPICKKFWRSSGASTRTRTWLWASWRKGRSKN
jgi:hypothetical protein